MAYFDKSGEVSDFSILSFKLDLPQSDVVISTSCS